MSGPSPVLIGVGPSAIVYAGVDHAGEPCARKVYPGALDPAARTQLEAEIARLAAVAGDGLLLVPDAIEDLPDGRTAIRTELCAMDLRALVGSSGPLRPDDAIALGEALARALAAGHDANLAHGGVSPGNVLFRPSGEPVLADFGLTLRHSFPATQPTELGLRAPEATRPGAHGAHGERADLYGLGAVLHVALTGSVPPSGRPVAFGDDCPAALADLVSALLRPDPAARPPAALVAARLADLAEPVKLEGEPEPDHGVTDPDAAADPAEAVVAMEVFDDFPLPAAAGPASDFPPAPPPPALAPVFVSDVFAAPAARSAPALASPSTGQQPEPDVASDPVRSNAARGRGRMKVLAAAVAAVAALTLAAGAAWALPGDAGETIEASDPAPAPEPAPEPAPDPAPAPAPKPEPVAGPAPPVDARPVLAAPMDRGDAVDLAWESGAPMSFAVVVAAAGEPTQVLMAESATTYSVPVTPGQPYCFLIQATDGERVLESVAHGIRGARCET